MMTSDQKVVLEVLDNMNTRNSKMLASFVRYCFNWPDLRFWQALLNWSCFPYLFVATARPVIYDEKIIWRDNEVFDPYNWEEKNPTKEE